jgi:hypothetical protein
MLDTTGERYDISMPSQMLYTFFHNSSQKLKSVINSAISWKMRLGLGESTPPNVSIYSFAFLTSLVNHALMQLYRCAQATMTTCCYNNVNPCGRSNSINLAAVAGG